MRVQCDKKFEDIASVENLLEAWREFLSGKRGKRDVQEFQLRLMDNILSLNINLISGRYRHGGYRHFQISDPKPRDIHKATVCDRLLHHAIYRQLYPFFDRTFIADSFSCRIGKGTHKAMSRFRRFAFAVSQNNMRTCWILKCDIKKFFANIDHKTLFNILDDYIPDEKMKRLLQEIIKSFSARTLERGLPLGNLTSQLFVNIYMNEFDQFVKHRLKAKYYIRYADDFVFMSPNRMWLEHILSEIEKFLNKKLKLQLHPDKVFIKTLASGIDFLGWIHFPDHRVLRSATKRRMLRRIEERPTKETLASYQGMLKHGNTFKISQFLPDSTIMEA